MDYITVREKIRHILDQRIVGQLIRYGLTTGVSYIFLFLGTYILIDICKFPGTLSYAIVLTIVYIGVFFSYLNFVFKKSMSGGIVTRFIIFLCVFWTLNNVLFHILYDIFHIAYIIAILTNLIVFGVIRFFIQRRFVFKAHA